MQVESTSLRSVTAPVGEVVSAASQSSHEALEAPTGRQAARPAEAQVPFPHHVCGVSCFHQALWEGGDVRRQAERLT